MTEEVEKRLWSLAILAVIAFACACAGAIAADRTDPSFGQGGVAVVPLPPEARGTGAAIWDLAAAPDGKMAAALADYAGFSYFGAARFDRDGSPDPSFGGDGFAKPIEISQPGTPGTELTTQAQGVAVQDDGKVVVVGYQENALNDTAIAVARYRANGSLDQSFGEGGIVAPSPPSEYGAGKHPGGGEALHGVAIQPGGRIIAVGARNETHGGRPAGLVLAYRPDGRIDRRFGHEGRILFPSTRDRRYTALRAVKVLDNGKILVVGYRRGRLFVARTTPDGDPDRAFGGGDGAAAVHIGRSAECLACGTAASLAVDSRRRLVVLGASEESLPVLARFHLDGSLDRSFGRRGILSTRPAKRLSQAFDVSLQEDDRIVVAGLDERVSDDRRIFAVFAALRYFPNGRLDRNFSDGGLQTVGTQSAALSLLPRGDGRIVVAGAAEGAAGETELLLTRFLAD